MEYLKTDNNPISSKIALGLYAANEGLEYSYDKDKNNKKLNVIWKDFQKYLMQHFHIPNDLILVSSS